MPQINRTFRIYQNLLVSVGIIVFCVAAIFVGILPASRKVVDQLQVSSELGNELETLETKLRVLDGMDETQLREELSTLLAAVPADKSLPSIFSTVEGVAARSDVAILEMAISGVGTIASHSGSQTALEKQLGSRILPFSVIVEGPISNIQQFITVSSQVRRLLRLRTFSISFPKQNEALRISLQMDAFYAPFPTNIGTLSSTVPTLSEKDTELINKLSEFAQLGGTLTSGETLPPPVFGPPRVNPFSP